MIFNQRIGGAGGETASIFAYSDQLQSTDTVYAEKGGKRINGVWKTKENPDWVDLPAEYQQVEYLESTGEQWIDTLVSGGASASYKINFSVSDFVQSWQQYFAGDKATQVPKIFGGDNVQYLAAETLTDGLTDIGKPIGDFLIEYKNGLLRLNQSDTFSFSVGGWGNLTWWIFNAHEESTLYSKMKLFSCEMETDGTFVRGFIPCYRISDHKPGLYDTVNDVFYVNQGTGADFIVGADVSQYKIGFELSPIEEYGTWILTASNGTTTKSIDVLIDAAEEFEIEVKSTATVALVGSFNSTHGYVTIGETKYMADGTHEVQIGDTVVIYLSGSSSSQNQKCKVTLNGTTVKSGDYYLALTYNYTVTGDCTITLTRGGSTFSYYYTAAITTD